ncbi:hypothetical protein [Streptacidiphilus fuscans]|uniref:Uncharacterized protein n=1 Tax=Streptacidiphilus fuscans TaxID=2789292 RepID=A0A931B7M5_9ACTN|nr:hypothetical protein [Streptacidiphilus fuscans]MBF9070516.1 hypothetical protein [Streptacidiphilus fuscans]
MPTLLATALPLSALGRLSVLGRLALIVPVLGLLLGVVLSACAGGPAEPPSEARPGTVDVTLVPGPPGAANSGSQATPSASTSGGASPTGTAHPPAYAPQTPTDSDGTAGASGSATETLPVGSCVGTSADHYAPVACTSSAAYARVIARLPRGDASGSSVSSGTATSSPSSTACPADTDFVLGLTKVDAAHPQGVDAGIACLRLLQGPHPGDPGGGASGWLLPGDCLYNAGGNQLQAIPCLGDVDGHHAQFRITLLVSAPSACPLGTEQTIALRNPGQGTQYGCLVDVLL